MAAIPALIRNRKATETTDVLAKDALNGLQEWGKWMSGIQAAIAGGLLALIFKPENSECLPSLGEMRGLVGSALACMGAGLFCTATVLFAIPSQMIRLKQPDEKGFDVYERSLYLWLPWLRLGSLMAFQFWLFFFGLISLAILLIRRLPY